MRCPACLAEDVSPNVAACPHCGERFELPDDGVASVIPYRNVKALLAYYFGVFGLIPCVGAVLGPAALILGLLGLMHVNRNPHAKGTGHAIAGIVLGGIESLGYLVILVLILIGAIAR